MQAVGSDGWQVLVRDAREAVLVHEVPVRVCCGTGQQSQFIVGKCVSHRILAGAGVVRVVALRGVAEDDNDIVAREFPDSVVQLTDSAIEGCRTSRVLVVGKGAEWDIPLEVVGDADAS